jgi:hypothetical protein
VYRGWPDRLSGSLGREGSTMSDTEQNVASTVDTTEEQQRSERDRELAEQLVEQAKDQGS